MGNCQRGVLHAVHVDHADSSPSDEQQENQRERSHRYVRSRIRTRIVYHHDQHQGNLSDHQQWC